MFRGAQAVQKDRRDELQCTARKECTGEPEVRRRGEEKEENDNGQ